MIYLDNAATTQIHPEVLDAVMPYLKEEYGNAGAMYGLGRRAANAVSKAREQVARLIGCEAKQIIFTSGGSEANSLVFAGLRPHLLSNGKTHIITSAVEHDSVLKAVKSVCNPLCRNAENDIKSDFHATILGVTSGGTISSNELQHIITERTGLASIMYVNNETGATNPVREIGKICRKRGILFHTDCVQAVGFHKTNVADIDCDFLSISSHKINAPKGVGALYAKDPSLLTPIIHGGDAQEFGCRGGTENVAGIVGFGKACELLTQNIEVYRESITRLRVRFMEMFEHHMTILGLKHAAHINLACDSGKIINIRFDGVDGQTLLLMLDANGVCVSSGSACRSHETNPSHVLLAMGLTEDEARSSVRISFSYTQSMNDMDAAAATIANCVATLKGVQPM